MKKLFIFVALLVFIPFFIVLIYNKNYKEINLNFVSNITIRVKRQNNNDIVSIPLEEYIVGVLAGEMPISFELEALKAQAVASRSYALARIEYNKDMDYDVVDTTVNQVYLDDEYLKKAWGKNYVKNINKLKTAVNYTIDEYLSYDGKVADALFFSTSNGYTEDSNNVFGFKCDYLKSVESPWDKDVSSAFNASKKMKLSTFYNKLGLDYNKNLNVSIINRSKTNRILSLKVNGVKFSGIDIYQKLGLRSLDFEFVLLGEEIEIKTVGYGHGVGMSQYGALGMALEGFTYQEILKYYYSGTEIKKI